MTVTINKSHCENRIYADIHGCPLFAAIKKQHPNFALESVGGNCIIDTNKNIYKINAFIWNEKTMSSILNGNIESVKVEISDTPVKDACELFYGGLN